MFSPMSLSVSHLVLRARQLDIDALRHLAARIDLVDVIGQLIHALQRERGATSVFLASGGQRFAAERSAATDEARPLATAACALFERDLAPSPTVPPRLLTLMAWVLLDLDALDALRAQVAAGTPSAHDAVAAFSRLIAGLLELVFQLADTEVDPGLTRQLVAHVHLLQGKEAAGQERAVGAQLLASGQCDEAEQQRIVHLIDAQERSLRVFEDLADAALTARWQQAQLAPGVAQLERLRRLLCMGRPGGTLDTALSDTWFDVTSERIATLATLQASLVQNLKQTCALRLQAAEQDLQDSEGLLLRLRDNRPAHVQAVDRFFSSHEQPAAAPVLSAVDAASNDPTVVAALKDLLATQSAQLSTMEVELQAARRTLQDRKVIERAKGVLMARMNLSEEAAFRTLQKASMDHNRRLVDVAEAALALPDAAFGPGGTPRGR